MHATRISILPKNSVVFHSVSSERYYGKIVMLPSVSNRAAIRRYKNILPKHSFLKQNLKYL